MDPHSFYEMIKTLELIYQNNICSSLNQQENHQQGSSITLAEYQSQYKKNYEIMKNKYKKTMVPSLSFEEIVKCVLFLNNSSIFSNETEEEIIDKKRYCFMCSLAFFEKDSQKDHESFKEEDWKKLAALSRFLSEDEIFQFKDQTFKNNLVNYQWSSQEDMHLKEIITDQIQKKGKISWLETAKQLNQRKDLLQIRKPSHCFERWKNTLKHQYKKGEWTRAEDIIIFKYLIENGTKWSKLAQIFNETRTEHNLKNRFFSVLAKILKLSTKKVKKTVDYRKKDLLLKAIKILEGK